MQAKLTPSLARVVPGGPPQRSEQGSLYQPGLGDQTVGASAGFMGVRSDATAQESVLMRPELDACVP